MLSTFTTDMLSILGVFYVLKLCPILIGFMLTQFKIYKIFLSVQYFDDKFKLSLYSRVRNSTTHLTLNVYNMALVYNKSSILKVAD